MTGQLWALFEDGVQDETLEFVLRLHLGGDGTQFVRRDGLLTCLPFNNITLRDGDPLEDNDFA